MLLFALIFTVVGVGCLNANDFVVADVEVENVPIYSESDFINALSVSSNYSGKRIVLYKDLDFTDYANELSTIYSTAKTFSGEFDGNGYSLNNITYSSTNQNYGLFTDAENAVIKNVKLGGTVTYNISSEGRSQAYIGGLVGYGSGVVIQNCEIGEDVKFVSKVNETPYDNLQFSTKVTFGGLAGVLENVSKVSTISNCVNHADISISTSLSASSSIKIGNLVGRLFDSVIEYSVGYGDITYFANSSNITFYNGGIAGEVEGDRAKIINCVFIGSMQRGVGENFAESYNGGIVGSISETSYPVTSGISYTYWTDKSLENFGRSIGYKAQPVDKVEWVETTSGSLPGSFFTTYTNWNQLYDEWDFDKTWMVSSSESGAGSLLNLQCFQMFSYRMSEQLDTGMVIDPSNATFTGGTIEGDTHLFRYGQEVVINIGFTAKTQGFYSLRSILLDANELPSTAYVKEAVTDINGRITGYKITLSASGLTDGVYSFALDPISYLCVVETEDIDKGGVKYRGGSVSRPSLNMNLTLESNEQTIVAEPKSKSIYVFDHWDLYYMQNGSWVLGQGSFSVNSNLVVDFGVAPFDKQFKLIANFSEDALVATFTKDENKDENIVSVNFDGQEYEGEGLKVSSSALIDLVVTVEAGYELDIDKFLQAVQSLYGSYSTNAVSKSTRVNENGETEYRFVLNMGYIKERLGANNNEFSISLTSIRTQDGDENDLLWLWITLPIVGVLLIGGVVIFIVVRNYRYKHGAGKFGGGTSKGSKASNKKVKEKSSKNDFKDFYY